MSDLIARLLDVCQCNLDSSPCGNEDTCLLLREAAEALEAKDAEIERQRKQIIRMGNQFDKKNRQIIAAVTEADALRARFAAAIDALEQAQDCIRDETPECGTWEEARDDTLAKIRAVILPPHAPAKETGDE